MAEKKLLVDEQNKLFDTKGMFYKEFASDINQIRFFTVLITKNAIEDLKEKNLLEQQVSEIVKNAVLHGNKCDKSKKVRVWYNSDKKMFRLIVEDEGDGFQDLEKWNTFLSNRMDAFESGDPEKMMEYVAWRTEKSGPNDGGNSLFAAVEYWNGGIVYNNKKNKVAVARAVE
ncbi:MAG: ATP-binding protein [Spirochaetes bacterium]|nr:ATP-binding protein [Spirochaetota bacterium]